MSRHPAESDRKGIRLWHVWRHLRKPCILLPAGEPRPEADYWITRTILAVSEADARKQWEEIK